MQHLSWYLAIWRFSIHWEPLLLHLSISYHSPYHLHIHSPTSLKDPKHTGECSRSELNAEWKMYLAFSFLGRAPLIFQGQPVCSFHAQIFPPWIFHSILDISLCLKILLLKANTFCAFLPRNSPQSTGRNLNVFLAVGKEPAEHWRDSFDDIVFHFAEDDSCFSP